MNNGSLHDTDAEYREAYRELHELWKWAVGLPGYDKKKWQSLEAHLTRLARRGGQP